MTLQYVIGYPRLVKKTATIINTSVKSVKLNKQEGH